MTNKMFLFFFLFYDDQDLLLLDTTSSVDAYNISTIVVDVVDVVDTTWSSSRFIERVDVYCNEEQ